jgi:tripartite-type tricarboxylate transporter receptor subunit TctC
MSSVPSAIAQIKGSKLRPIVVTSAKRSHLLPDIPTINESGFKGFDANTWFGLLVPAGTSPEIIKRLNVEVNRVLKMPEVREKIGAEGGEAMGSTPEEFAQLIKTDIVKWAKVVKESGAKID